MDPKNLTIISSVRSLFFTDIDDDYRLTEKFSQRIKKKGSSSGKERPTQEFGLK
jgi:hypothetical protein